jgi:hypothetical protein
MKLEACQSCSGVGFGHLEDGVYKDTGKPCEVCNAGVDPKPAGFMTPKPAGPKSPSIAWIGAPGDPNAPPMTAEEAGFAPEAVAAAADTSKGGGG